VYRIRFRQGIRPGTHWGYSTPPDSLAGLKGPTSKRRGKEEREKKGMGGTGPLKQIPGSAPAN